MALPLKGIRILDSAHQYPGPYCSMLLADLGAEVVKVERPGIGDQARQFPHFFRSINRNKKSLTLNLRDPAGREIFYRLVERYDVFTEGFRPGVASRLGIDYESLRKINSGLIYCSISGYGQEGPYRDLPGHDLNYQAMAGMLQCFEDPDGKLMVPRISIADLSSGMFATIGILAALMERVKSGRGQYIDISMLDGLLSWMSTNVGMSFATGNFDWGQDAGYGIFKAKDNRFFTLGIAHENWFWDRLCSAIGLEQYAGLPALERRERRSELAEELQAIFSQKPLQEWMKIIVEADVPISPVKTLEEVAKDPHVRFREMIKENSLPSGERIRQVSCPIKLSRSQQEIRTLPPDLGEQTEEVLSEIGYSEEEVAQLKNDGIL